jgi:hypothetical protein
VPVEADLRDDDPNAASAQNARSGSHSPNTPRKTSAISPIVA